MRMSKGPRYDVDMMHLQINIVKLELFEALINCFRNIRDVRHHLGRHEEVLARHTTLFDRHPHFGLSAVNLCPVQMEVSQLDCIFDCID